MPDPIAAAAGAPESIDVTGIVSAWFDGSLPNHGLLLDHQGPGRTTFVSKDAPWYTPGVGETGGKAPALTICFLPGCDNGVIDDGETDVDCGGATCAPCGIYDWCCLNTDCASGVCDHYWGYCVPADRDSGAQDGTETGVDCGGGFCDACGVGGGCVVDADCGSGVCQAGACLVAPTCSNFVLDGTEVGVDCGGLGCPPCSDSAWWDVATTPYRAVAAADAGGLSAVAFNRLFTYWSSGGFDSIYQGGALGLYGWGGVRVGWRDDYTSWSLGCGYQSYFPTSNAYFADVASDGAHGFAVLGVDYDASCATMLWFLRHVDAQGVTQWETSLGKGVASQVQADAHGDYYVYGSQALLKIDQAGNLLSSVPAPNADRMALDRTHDRVVLWQSWLSTPALSVLSDVGELLGTLPLPVANAYVRGIVVRGEQILVLANVPLPAPWTYQPVLWTCDAAGALVSTTPLPRSLAERRRARSCGRNAPRGRSDPRRGRGLARGWGGDGPLGEGVPVRRPDVLDHWHPPARRGHRDLGDVRRRPHLLSRHDRLDRRPPVLVKARVRGRPARSRGAGSR
jgi:hypothetical protein